MVILAAEDGWAFIDDCKQKFFGDFEGKLLLKTFRTGNVQ